MGLQFTGREEVKRLAASVSISKEVIEQAADLRADVLIAHHGLFWNNEPRALDNLRGRLKLLEQYGISVLGYHLALDRHSKVGNNVLAVRKLQLGKIKPWQDVGYQGEYKRPMERQEFFQKALEKFTDYEPPVPEPIDFFQYGPSKIKRVALITGGAPHYIAQAAQDGFDTFVTGETAEPTLYLAQDLEMNFLSLGHYRTETLGVRALCGWLGTRFGLDWTFISPSR
jgi:dinuclear metal center YbgI/SA1388 family protein